MSPLRLDQEVFQAGADQIEVAGRATGDEGSDPAAVLDGELHRDLAQRRIRRAFRVSTLTGGMQHDGDDAAGHWQSLHERRLLPRGKHQPAEQARHDIVPMRRIGCDALAFERKGQQLLERERIAEQSIGGGCAGDRGCGRTAHAGAQRHALVDRQPHSERASGRLEDSARGGERGVRIRLLGKRIRQSSHLSQPNASLRFSRRR